MNKAIYDYTNYKLFLNDFIKSRPYQGRGMRTKIAKTLRIHTAYVSQVLNKDAHFTLEQSEELTEFLGLTNRESDFLILLVQKERAGSYRLREYFTKQLNKIAEEQKKLKHRLEADDEIQPIDQQTYYSSWHYIAVHALLSIEKYQDKNLIAQKLKLPIDRVGEILEFLLKIGLVDRIGDKFKMGAKDLHLSGDSPMISKHHTNWRMQAINSLDTKTDEELHYSGIISIREEDAKIIKNIMINSLQNIRKVLKESEPEEVYCYTVDMFPI